MFVKIGRGHKPKETIQIGNATFRINQFYDSCIEECDLQELNICRKIACNSHDRLDNTSVAFEFVDYIK